MQVGFGFVQSPFSVAWICRAYDDAGNGDDGDDGDDSVSFASIASFLETE